jgi:hypothetical protein
LGYTALYPTRNTSVFIIHSLITLSFNASWATENVVR